MKDDQLPRPLFNLGASSDVTEKAQDPLCVLVRGQSDLTISLADVHGQKHAVYAQTGADGKIRVVTLPCEKIDVSPDALEELAKLVREVTVIVGKNGVRLGVALETVFFRMGGG